MMEHVIRRYACASGRVQGVGFRMFVRQQGVMNMSDGTVTMELQGAESAVETAFAAMRGGNYFIHVEHLEIEEREPVDGERDFTIKY